jgi:hypothetical protein
MDIRTALKGQYRAGLLMLRQSVERCPDDLWIGGKHPRAFWRIAYHASFYALFYMQQGVDSFCPWPKHRDVTDLWDEPELWTDPAKLIPYSKEDLLESIDYTLGQMDGIIDGLDLETDFSGFPWYPDTPKLDHEIMNVRHLQGHVGQLSELLMERGIDVDWMGKR